MTDKLICPQCRTRFHFNEVRNIVHHRKEKMPINCPKCSYIVKEKLSHGYFVSYLDKEFDYKKQKNTKRERPTKYKNMKTGAIISAEDYQKMIEGQEWIINNPQSSGWLGMSNQFLENEVANCIDSYENYLPYSEEYDE